jgi:frataxin
MLTETEFHIAADTFLTSLFDTLDALDSDLEPELEQGSLSMTFENGKQYLINKHAPSRQLWVASPISGGLHFAYSDGSWVLKDGREILALVRGEIFQLSGISL